MIAVAERLRELSPACELLLVGTREGPERGLAAAAGLSYAGVSSGKLRRYWSFQNFVDPVRVASGLIASLRLVRRFDPDVGFGAGGLSSELQPTVSGSKTPAPIVAPSIKKPRRSSVSATCERFLSDEGLFEDVMKSSNGSEHAENPSWLLRARALQRAGHMRRTRRLVCRRQPAERRRRGAGWKAYLYLYLYL